MHHMHLVARNPTLLHANNKGAVQPAHPHNVISALDGVHVIAKLLHAQRIQNRAYRVMMRVSIIYKDVLADLICAQTVC